MYVSYETLALQSETDLINVKGNIIFNCVNLIINIKIFTCVEELHIE